MVNSSDSKHQGFTLETAFVANITSAQRPCGCPAVQCQQGCAGSRPGREALEQCCTRRRLHVAAARVRRVQRSSSSCVRSRQQCHKQRPWKISDNSIECEHGGERFNSDSSGNFICYAVQYLMQRRSSCRFEYSCVSKTVTATWSTLPRRQCCKNCKC